MNNTTTITVNFHELVILYILLTERIELCDENLETSLSYGDVEGANYWTKEKTLATKLQERLDGVI